MVKRDTQTLRYHFAGSTQWDTTADGEHEALFANKYWAGSDTELRSNCVRELDELMRLIVKGTRPQDWQPVIDGLDDRLSGKQAVMPFRQWIRWFETALMPTKDGFPSAILNALVANHHAALTKGDAMKYSGKTDQQIIEIIHGRILPFWRGTLDEGWKKKLAERTAAVVTKYQIRERLQLLGNTIEEAAKWGTPKLYRYLVTRWRQPSVEEKKFALRDIITLIEQGPYVLRALANHGDGNKSLADAATEGAYPEGFTSHQMAAAAEIFGLAEIAEAVKAAPEDSGSGSSITMVAALTLLIALARRQAS